MPIGALYTTSFTTIENHNTLKHCTGLISANFRFTTIENHNTLKPNAKPMQAWKRFTTIENHNTLKHVAEADLQTVGFTTIENHNTLKPQIAFSCIGSLQVYPLTPGGATLDGVSLFKDLA